MSRRTILFPVWALVCGIVGCGEAGPGPVIRPAGGRFSVAFPAAYGPPAETVRTWTRAGGSVELHTWTAAGVDGCAWVAFSDHQTDKDRPPAEALDRACRQAVEACGGMLEGEPADSGGDRPSRDFRFSAGSAATRLAGRGRVVVDAGRVFQVVMLAGRPSDCDGPVAKSFLDSFRVLSQEPAQPKSPLSQPSSADNLPQ